MAEIFVFGSNLAGIHGAGSALAAKKFHGAIQGVGTGLQGNSYAIPTKDRNLNTLPLTTIKFQVERFIIYAAYNQQHIFRVVAIGCGLAGYKPHQIGPMFKDVPPNVYLPKEFMPYI